MIQTCDISGNPETAYCKICIYWRLEKDDCATMLDGTHVPIGECRKKSPIKQFKWPYTKESDWCGDFQHV